MDETVDVEMHQEPPTAQEITSEWFDAFENDPANFGAVFKYWDVWVPKIYSPTLDNNCLNWQFNEDLAKEVSCNIFV